MINFKETLSSFKQFVLGTDKEKHAISKLPPTIFRLFGEGLDFYQQLSTIPDQFRDNVIILTTADTPENELSTIRGNFKVIQSDTVTTDLAKKNSSLLLNEALKFGRENGYKYLFYLSSGFQRHLEMFYSMTQSVMERYPNRDAYYFVLPETHDLVSLEAHKHASELLQRDTHQFLKSFFPFETALVMNTSMFDFETSMSEKGAMGNVPNSNTPIGGMEFMMTLWSKYAEQKRAGILYSPNMIGVTLPVPTRIELADHFYRKIYPHYLSSPSSLANQASLEVTTSGRKIDRRDSTFQAALKRLNLNDIDVQLLFANTHFISGVTEAFRFENGKSSLY